MTLENKVCVITGGGSGIGMAAAMQMAAEGASVVLAGRTASKVEAAQKQIESAGGAAMAYGLDVADYKGVQKMAKAVLDRFGRIDVLVNNAGHSSPHRRLLSTTPEEIRAVIDSNLVGTIYCSQAFVPAMLEAKSGTIINVASMAGKSPGLLGGMIPCALPRQP